MREKPKPAAVRVAGWACFALIGVGAWGIWRGGGQPLTGRVLAGCFGYCVATAGFGLVWAAGTVAWKVRQKLPPRESRGRGIAEELTEVSRLAGPRLHINEPRKILELSAAACELCRERPALLTCAAHRARVCWPCLLEHDSEGLCFYFPVTGITNQARRRAVAQSPAAAGNRGA